MEVKKTSLLVTSGNTVNSGTVSSARQCCGSHTGCRRPSRESLYTEQADSQVPHFSVGHRTTAPTADQVTTVHRFNDDLKIYKDLKI
jgi:hypothetical protein